MKKNKLLIGSILLLFVVPILFGAITYAQENSKDKEYNATVQVSLDNLNTSVYSNPATVEKMLKSEKFLSSVKVSDVETVKNSMSIEKNNDWVIIGLKGNQKEEVSNDLEAIVSKLLNDSEEIYNKQVQLIENTINELKESNNTDEKILETEQFLYDLELKKINALKAEIQDPITITEVSANPMKRAIVSGILGFAIMVIILIVGVLFYRRG